MSVSTTCCALRAASEFPVVEDRHVKGFGLVRVEVHVVQPIPTCLALTVLTFFTLIVAVLILEQYDAHSGSVKKSRQIHTNIYEYIRMYV